MIEEKRDQAVANAMDAFSKICTDFDEEFSSQIGDLDKEPERDRIFILEDIIRKSQQKSSESLLNYTQELIESIDEEELIRRKKGNMKERE
ncbi:MAG: hypothetical protein IJ719_07335 [Clostridia bacterium]|nr:hypothetical protein [Clostridia bacterium]